MCPCINSDPPPSTAFQKKKKEKKPLFSFSGRGRTLLLKPSVWAQGAFFYSTEMRGPITVRRRWAPLHSLRFCLQNLLPLPRGSGGGAWEGAETGDWRSENGSKQKGPAWFQGLGTSGLVKGCGVTACVRVKMGPCGCQARRALPARPRVDASLQDSQLSWGAPPPPRAP